MGSWDSGTFDNDTACDWAYSLEEVGDLSLVQESLDKVTESDEAIGADDACEALAACEVIARLKGNWGKRDSHTETVDAWVNAHPGVPAPAMIQEAVQAIDRILAPESELAQLWAESDSAAEWQAAVKELRARVLS